LAFVGLNRGVHIPVISRDDLLARIDSGADFVLVDALAPMSFAASHLPGAINLPPAWVDERAPSRIPNRASEIVVYCSAATCDSSVLVAERLAALGYTNLWHYVEGKEDWVAAGLPLEGGRV
jgi:rhodanese-related sulfurtransferase